MSKYVLEYLRKERYEANDHLGEKEIKERFSIEVLQVRTGRERSIPLENSWEGY